MKHPLKSKKSIHPSTTKANTSYATLINAPINEKGENSILMVQMATPAQGAQKRPNVNKKR